jgi:hypothetical protein
MVNFGGYIYIGGWRTSNVGRKRRGEDIHATISQQKLDGDAQSCFYVNDYEALMALSRTRPGGNHDK